jgi:hypothetical protein
MENEEAVEEVETTPEEAVEAVEDLEEEIDVPYTETESVPLEELAEADKTYTSKAFLFREYVIEGKSMHQIAEDQEVDPLFVKKYLVDYDIYDPTRETL